MALTRRWLSTLGIDADKIDEIIAAHAETVDGLKDQLKTAQASADKLPGVQKELDDLKAATSDESGFKDKYEKEHAAFEKFKADAAAEKVLAQKQTAYKAILKDAGITTEKAVEKVLKYTRFEDLEIGDDGKLKDAAKLLKSAKEEWPELITTEGQRGAETGNPPANTGGAVKTREEIYKRDESGRFVLDASERQKALANLIASESGQKG